MTLNVGRCQNSRGGTRNVVLTGATSHCHVPTWADPLSIKAVCYGEVQWRFGSHRYRIHTDTLLLVPDGDDYELTIDTPQPSRGFNVLFRRGLIEDCWRAAVAIPEALLEAPEDSRPVPFPRRLESRGGPLGRAVDALAGAVFAGAPSESADWLFESLAVKAVQSLLEQRRERSRITGLRPATRLEIQRRLELAREAVEGDLAIPWTLRTMSRAAMMSPHHFHRSFRRAFRETPHSWLSRRRAERAMALLLSTRRSVTEICFAVGYSSPGSFSSAFTARYGSPPSRVQRRWAIADY